MSLELAQRLYDMQSDESFFDEDESEERQIDQEEIDNQYKDIDSIEKLFVQAKRLKL